MDKYSCGKPDWAAEEDCPMDTGELERCEECPWGVEREGEP